MFVAIAMDPGSKDRARELADLLAQYGFKAVQRGLWESSAISPDTLIRVKKDLDKITDAFDRLRFFQFPMDGTLVLSSLKDKKWRRIVARDVEGDKDHASQVQPAKGKTVPVVQRVVAGVRPKMQGSPLVRRSVKRK